MTKASEIDAPFVALHDLISGDEDARACRDISDSQCREQPRNFGVHLVALSLTKIGDGLADAKLVLSWLLDALGAPAATVAMLVPVRESLSLLPQLAVAGWMRRQSVRKWFWVGGSVGQAISLFAMAMVAWRFEGATAGWSIVGLLAIFSLARGVCSVASKDVLGKTIAKQRRGTLTGYASTVAGLAVITLGLALQLEPGSERGVGFFVGLLATGAALWLISAGVFALLEEYPGASDGGANALREAIAGLKLVVEDSELRRFLIARALLVSTALMAPFIAILSRDLGGTGLSDLGILVLASGIAASVSAGVWGRWSDRSSRIVMAAAGALAAFAGIAVSLCAYLIPEGGVWIAYLFGALYFLLSVAHTGVRLGRKTHLVDMAGSENRASYVAVSNTLIGIVLLLGGGAGVLADTAGPALAVMAFAIFAALGALASLGLEDAQA